MKHELHIIHEEFPVHSRTLTFLLSHTRTDCICNVSASFSSSCDLEHGSPLDILISSHCTTHRFCVDYGLRAINARNIPEVSCCIKATSWSSYSFLQAPPTSKKNAPKVLWLRWTRWQVLNWEFA